jgi:hypothetical protein
MHARTLTLLLAAATGLAASVATTPTAADSGKPAPILVAPAVQVAPPGYTVKVKGPFTAPAGKLTRAAVSCAKPYTGAWVLLGGGALVASHSPLVSLASDYPILRLVDQWVVSVTNLSSSATSFSVYAICRSTSGGGENISSFSVAPHSLATVNAPTTCSGPAVRVWGPRDTSGRSTQITIHETRPALDGLSWTVAMNNTGGATRSFDVFEECVSDDTGERVVEGAPVDNPAFSQTLAFVLCDTGVPLAGGVSASSTSTLVSVNSSSPITGGWQAYENNASAQDDTIRAWVLCSTA